MTPSKRALPFAWLILGLLAFPAIAPATPPAVDLAALIHDTQRTAPGNDQMSLAWWVPEEYWRVSFAQEKTLSAEGIEEMLKALHPYTLVAVVDGKMGPMGGVTFRPEAEVRKDIVLVDTSGKEHRPLDDDAINKDVKLFLGFIKPILGDMMGSMGESMYFFAFPSHSEAGKPLANALGEGTLSVKVGEQSFDWKLPLGSLMPPKVCPKDKEILNGAWTYCPWHGEKLAPAD